MNTQLKNQKKTKINAILFILACALILAGSFLPLAGNQAYAASNLIKGGSFEGSIDNDWMLWQVADSSRNYEMFRHIESAFGFGSYSLAVSGEGSPENAFSAGIQSDPGNAFSVEAGKTYQLVMHSRASANIKSFFFLKRSDDDRPVSGVEEVNFSNGSGWEKKTIIFEATESARAQLCFVFGSMPNGANFNLDGLQLFSVNTVLSTKAVKGYIKENKYIYIKDLGYYNLSDVEIELPFYNERLQATTKRFHPYSIENDKAYFAMPEGSFSGIGRVYVSNVLLGSFDYSVLPSVDIVHPSVVLANEQLIIYGSGFIPKAGQTYVIVKTKDVSGKTYDAWLEPLSMDTKLSQIVVAIPTGVVPSNLYVRTSFYNSGETDTIFKSKAFNYKVKPVIFDIDWAERGYEQVGDTLVIRGRGLAYSPVVNFYNENDELINSGRAELVEITDTEEVIHVPALKTINKYRITVTVNKIESDYAGALSQDAMPVMKSIKSSVFRTFQGSKDKISAARIGEEITISGEGFKADFANIGVEFQGYERRIMVTPTEENIKQNYGQVKVAVPGGVLNGMVCLFVNSISSNCLPLEIIPTISSISPDPALPNETITIAASGVGPEIADTKIVFVLDKKNEITVSPEAINVYYDSTNVVVRAPAYMPNELKEIKLKSGYWYNDTAHTISVRPFISQAAVDLDTRILTIKGHGFSPTAGKNVITYKYADENKTVISPEVKMLGVFNTEEGQEIRVQIMDGYHYGFVQLAVDGEMSNEVNFGPVSIKRIVRRIEHVQADNAVRGVLYISGYNFGPSGGVKVGNVWADIHYRSDFFIIAVVNQGNVNDNPVIVAK